MGRGASDTVGLLKVNPETRSTAPGSPGRGRRANFVHKEWPQDPIHWAKPIGELTRDQYKALREAFIFGNGGIDGDLANASAGREFTSIHVLFDESHNIVACALVPQATDWPVRIGTTRGYETAKAKDYFEGLGLQVNPVYPERRAGGGFNWGIAGGIAAGIGGGFL